MRTAFCSQYAGAWKAPWLQLSLFKMWGMMIVSNFNKKHIGHLPYSWLCAQHFVIRNVQSWDSNLGLTASRAFYPKHYHPPTMIHNRTTVPNRWAEDQRDMKRDATPFQIPLFSFCKNDFLLKVYLFSVHENDSMINEKLTFCGYS